MFSLLVQDLPSKRKYSAVAMYSPDMLRKRELKPKLPLVLTAVQGRLDVVWDANMRFSHVLHNYQGSVSVSIHEPLTLGKKWKKVDFKKLPCQSESNSIV